VIPRSALVVALLAAPLAASAAPQIALDLSRTQDCVAPCAVFFDATATRDARSAHPFHELDYRWDFGDDAGEVWSLSGQPKSRAIGGIAGHLYTRPGTHRVTLEVTNAAGERSHDTRTVTVADPATAFAGPATTCVSTSGNFADCPAGARHVTSGDFPTSLGNAAGRRTLYRRGETFAWPTTLHLVDAAPAGAAIGAFGAGQERATLRAAPGVFLDPGDDWRVSDVLLQGPGTTSEGPAGPPGRGAGGREAAGPARQRGGAGGDTESGSPLSAVSEHDGVRRFTLANVAVRGFNGCATFWSPNEPDREVALVDVSCGDFPDPGIGSKLFDDTDHSMYLGLDIDKGDHKDPRDQTEFAFRSVYSIKKVIEHGRFRGRGPVQSKNLLQLRHCPSGWEARCPNGAVPSRYVIVSDNQFIEGAGPRTGAVIRTCDEAACTGAQGASNPMLDYIFERNLIQVAGAAGDQLQGVFQLQAASTSVRDNVADLQGWPTGGGPRLWFVMVDPLSNASRDPTRDVWVRHNTLYLGQGLAKGLVLCGSPGRTTDLDCSHNLVYAPGLAGGVTPTFGAGWSAEGNRVAAENPFAATPPARLTATLRSLAAFRAKPGESAGATLERGAPVRTGAR